MTTKGPNDWRSRLFHEQYRGKKRLPTPGAGAAPNFNKYVPTPSKTKTRATGKSPALGGARGSTRTRPSPASTVPRAGAAGERRTSGGPNKKRK